MAELITDFTWYQDKRGYRLVEADDIQPAQVVRKGGPLKQYRPLAKSQELFNVFAKTGHRRAFSASSMILVRSHMPDRIGVWSGGRQRGEPVPAVLAHADMMRDLLHGRSPRRGGRPYTPLPDLKAWLDNDRATGGIAFKIAPATLRDALWLQLAQNLSTGVIRQCRHCNEVFRAGQGPAAGQTPDFAQTSTASDSIVLNGVDRPCASRSHPAALSRIIPTSIHTREGPRHRQTPNCHRNGPRHPQRR